MNETQEQRPSRMDKVSIYLCIANQHLTGLQNCLQSAATEFEASVNGDDRQPCDQQMKIDLERALKQLTTCSTWLEQAFEMSAVQELFKTYRHPDRSPAVVPETQISADVR